MATLLILALTMILAGCVGLIAWKSGTYFERGERLAAAELEAKEATREARDVREKYKQVLDKAIKVSERNKLLERYAVIPNAEVSAAQILSEAGAKSATIIKDAKSLAESTIAFAEREATDTMSSARSAADRLRFDAAAERERANRDAATVRDAARTDADTIRLAAVQQRDDALVETDAIRLKSETARTTIDSETKQLRESASAIRRVIQGYGNEYIKPIRSVLDELAEEFAHAPAGQRLKEARKRTGALIRQGAAAACDYAEGERASTAERFVTDAFNGKVDSILSRVKTDNFGILEQQITDAFHLINANGLAFRNARILPEYLAARVDELKWAAVVHELREQSREEQRRIKEAMREEEKARREFERAQKEADREARLLREAAETARVEFEAAASASAAERQALLDRMTELEGKLADVESAREHVLSMAQQTRQGHVYIISNIGSFGDEIFKVGMTRRLEPLDRIKELGDASVPFPFDVHAMIFSDDAPLVEHTLHAAMLRHRVNKANHRKEFFRLGVADLRQLVESSTRDVHWTDAAAAAEYRETQVIDRMIATDPEAEQRYLARELVLEAVDEAVGDSDGDED